ncbi:MAG: hypothetical protein JKY54_13070 [Flavobacteriales bacterium]|nr:hypothetical protein [Flavobacteriales bacterium]
MKLLLLPFLFICTVALGQNSGFMGKKTFVDIGVQGIPNFNGGMFPQFSGLVKPPSGYSRFHNNMGVSMELGRSVNRNLVVNIGANLKLRSLYFPFIRYIGEDINGLDSIFGPGPENPYVNIYSLKLSVGGKLFTDGAIAPIGRFIDFGFTMNIANIRKGESIYKSLGDRTSVGNGMGFSWIIDIDSLGPAIDHPKPTLLPSVYIGIGRIIVLSKRIFINYLVRFYLPLSTKQMFFKYNLDEREPLRIEGVLYTDYPSSAQFPGNIGRNWRGDDTYTFVRLRKYMYANEVFEAKLSVGFLF